jgi:lysozyme family protein
MIMDRFDKAYIDNVGHEGGYANHPADHGGETYRGIARNFHPAWPGWVIVDEEKKAHPRRSDLNRALESDPGFQAMVKEFYRYEFWSKVRADDLPHPIGEKVFNVAVNMGIGRAGRLLQKAVNDCGAVLKIDGDIGPRTVNATQWAASRCGVDRVIDLICMAQAKKYRQIVAANPSQQVFLDGWLRRAAYRGV